jgi:hypothetical protein
MANRNGNIMAMVLIDSSSPFETFLCLMKAKLICGWMVDG